MTVSLEKTFLLLFCFVFVFVFVCMCVVVACSACLQQLLSSFISEVFNLAHYVSVPITLVDYLGKAVHETRQRGDSSKIKFLQSSRVAHRHIKKETKEEDIKIPPSLLPTSYPHPSLLVLQFIVFQFCPAQYSNLATNKGRVCILKPDCVTRLSPSPPPFFFSSFFPQI